MRVALLDIGLSGGPFLTRLTWTLFEETAQVPGEVTNDERVVTGVDDMNADDCIVVPKVVGKGFRSFSPGSFERDEVGNATADENKSLATDENCLFEVRVGVYLNTRLNCVEPRRLGQALPRQILMIQCHCAVWACPLNAVKTFEFGNIF